MYNVYENIKIKNLKKKTKNNNNKNLPEVVSIKQDIMR